MTNNLVEDTVISVTGVEDSTVHILPSEFERVEVNLSPEDHYLYDTTGDLLLRIYYAGTYIDLYGVIRFTLSCCGKSLGLMTIEEGYDDVSLHDYVNFTNDYISYLNELSYTCLRHDPDIYNENMQGVFDLFINKAIVGGHTVFDGFLFTDMTSQMQTRFPMGMVAEANFFNIQDRILSPTGEVMGSHPTRYTRVTMFVGGNALSVVGRVIHSADGRTIHVEHTQDGFDDIARRALREYRNFDHNSSTTDTVIMEADTIDGSVISGSTEETFREQFDQNLLPFFSLPSRFVIQLLPRQGLELIRFKVRLARETKERTPTVTVRLLQKDHEVPVRYLYWVASPYLESAKMCSAQDTEELFFIINQALTGDYSKQYVKKTTRPLATTGRQIRVRKKRINYDNKTD